MKKLFVLTLVTVAALSQAQLTATGPFVGSSSEGFESFPNYFSGFETSLSVFGGNASFDSANDSYFAIYEPNEAATWGLSGNGLAEVNSGTKGLGIEGGTAHTGILTLNTAVKKFGGYFGTTPNQDLTFTFFDASDNQIGGVQSVTTTGTALVWAGWSSNTDIAKIVMSGNTDTFPAMDDLQIDAVPEPATMTILGLGALAALKRRRK